MNYQNIHVNGNRMEPNRIYAGTRGSYITDVSFSFSGEWEGLTKKLIFYPVRGTPVYTVYTYGTVRIPARVMRNAGISVMLISGYRVTEDGKIGEKIITASASVLVESAESDIRNEPDIPEATVFEEIVAKLGAPYIGESGNWYIWDVDTHEFVDTGLPARGERGETGRGLTILGKYSSLDELRWSVKDAQPGDAYAVGEKAPYTIYIWDEVTGDFTDHGDMRGVGITKIEQITDNIGSGEPNTIRIYLDDGEEYDYTVYNGERGQPGNIWIGETKPPDDSYVFWLNPSGMVSGFVASYQGTENAGRALVVGEDGTVVPGEAKGNVELDTTLTQSGKAADAKAVGDALAALSGTNAELPFTENEISGVASGGGFVVNPTNFADGKTYFRYNAGSTYGFRWTNPNPQKGSLTITMRGYSQYSTTLSTAIVTVYTDGTNNSMRLTHGETVTYTTDPNKTVDYIRGNYDFENWVLLDMDVLSIVADYPAPTGTVKSVNGILPDENGNVEIPVSGGTLVEPAEDDIPQVYLTGIDGVSAPTTKGEGEVDFKLHYVSKSEEFSAYCTLKLQGDSSANPGYIKKNYTVKMFSDYAHDTKLKKEFRDWGFETNKYILKANWIDATHARQMVAYDIWSKIVKNREGYADSVEATLPNQGTSDGFPVIVYINDTYYGIYTWILPKSDKLFGVDEDDPNQFVIYGQLNTDGAYRKTANNFRELWSGKDVDNWEVEVGTNSSVVKTAVNNFTNFVMTSTDAEFYANLSNYCDVASLIDGYLFDYYLCGIDALAQNMILICRDGKTFTLGIWDRDSTFGLWWDGSKILSPTYRCPEDYQERYSLLWARLEGTFYNELKARKAELRADGAPLSFSNIVGTFDAFVHNIGDDRYNENNEAYFQPSKTTATKKQFREFVRDRLVYVDSCVDEFGAVIKCADITLSENNVEISGEGHTLTATLVPSATTQEVVWKSSNTSIATVEDGIVTGVADGAATITATCGQYSATCNVVVSDVAEPEEPTEIPCTGITLSDDTLTFTAAGSKTLTATVTPEDTTDTITWTSSDSGVASVLDGVVTAKATGNTTITAICGNYSASCNVVVNVNTVFDTFADAEWIAGELSEKTGEVSGTAGRHTGAVAFEQYAGRMMFVGGAGWSRILFYDDGGYTAYAQVAGFAQIPETTKYAKASIASEGNRLYADITDGNMLPAHEINEGSYNNNGTLNSGDTNSCHVMISVVPGETYVIVGAWGIRYFNADGEFVQASDLAQANKNGETVNVPEGAHKAAVCFRDHLIANGYIYKIIERVVDVNP